MGFFGSLGFGGGFFFRFVGDLFWFSFVGVWGCLGAGVVFLGGGYLLVVGLGLVGWFVGFGWLVLV